MPRLLDSLVQRFCAPCSVPRSWSNTRFTPIPKKNGQFRLIAIKSHAAKAVSKVILQRNWWDKLVGPHQYGARPGKSTADCIGWLGLALESEIPIIPHSPSLQAIPSVLLFLDIAKAFPSTEHGPLQEILAPELPPHDLRLLMELQQGTASIGPRVAFPLEFPLTRGVREGCPLGPVTFSAVFFSALDKAWLACPNPPPLEYRLFVDDLALKGSPEFLAAFIPRFVYELAKVGLSINIDKSNFIVPSPLYYSAPTRIKEALKLAAQPSPSYVRCDNCGRSFPKSRSLSIHLARWCRGSPQEEEKAPRSRRAQIFYRQSAPQRKRIHIYEDSTIFSFPCSSCGKRFKSSRGLRIHKAKSKCHLSPPKSAVPQHIYQGSSARAISAVLLPLPEKLCGVSPSHSVVYLGILFPDNGDWRVSIEHRANQAQGAISRVAKLASLGFLNWSVHRRFLLFNSLVLSVFTYGIFHLPLKPVHLQVILSNASRLSCRFLRCKYDGTPIFPSRSTRADNLEFFRLTEAKLVSLFNSRILGVNAPLPSSGFRNRVPS